MLSSAGSLSPAPYSGSGTSRITAASTIPGRVRLLRSRPADIPVAAPIRAAIAAMTAAASIARPPKYRMSSTAAKELRKVPANSFGKRRPVSASSRARRLPASASTSVPAPAASIISAGFPMPVGIPSTAIMKASVHMIQGPASAVRHKAVSCA
ncbi:hypothetical protein D3C75_616510 [compost metagenome]